TITRDYVPGGARANKLWFQRENMLRVIDMLEQWQPLCDKYHCAVPTLALAWILRQSELISILSGATSPEDYFYTPETKIRQQASFIHHIQIGRELHKPVIVHTRDARADTLAILREEKVTDCGGVLHCFTEDRETAGKLLDLGFYISFSGIVTFRNAEQLRDAARYVPLDRLLVETDSPYLAPVPHRGKENQPAMVRDVAEYMAVLKGVAVEELAQITTDNFARLFHIDASRLSSIR
ncbi:putative DNAse, partial [Salmonella enterica subsp. enterica serovar Enteritidis str. 6.0562-1]